MRGEGKVSSFFFLKNAGESVTQDSELVLVFKDHQAQMYFQLKHVQNYLGKLLGSKSFFLI